MKHRASSAEEAPRSSFPGRRCRGWLASTSGEPQPSSDTVLPAPSESSELVFGVEGNLESLVVLWPAACDSMRLPVPFASKKRGSDFDFRVAVGPGPPATCHKLQAARRRAPPKFLKQRPSKPTRSGLRTGTQDGNLRWRPSPQFAIIF